MADRRLVLVILQLSLCLGLACGGRRSAPARTGRSPIPAPTNSSGTIAPVREPTRLPASTIPRIPEQDWVQTMAPAPRIRVGLSTNKAIVRVTSAREFYVGDGEQWWLARDLLVEPVLDPAVTESDIFRVRVASFLSQESASRLLSQLRQDVTGSLAIDREPATGRYRVLVGEFSSEAAARDQADLLVGLGYDASPVVITRAMGRPTGLSIASMGVPRRRIASLSLTIVPTRWNAFVELDGEPYRGFTQLFVNATNRLSVVNVVNLEDYLRGVVPAELSPEVFPELEALKAQSVAARTYVLKHLGQFDSEGYDLCPTAACQVYRGMRVEHPLANAAVAATRNQVLTSAGSLIDALYTSTCGGRTENAENVFSNSQTYLVSRACFVESRPAEMFSRVALLPLPVGVARRLGIVDSELGGQWSLAAWEQPASFEETRRWLTRLMAVIGHRPCGSGSSGAKAESVTWREFAALLSERFCWEGRLPFLLGPSDAGRWLADDGGFSKQTQAQLAYAVQSGLLVPPEEGFSIGAELSRRRVIETIVRILERQGESPWLEVRSIRFDGAQLWVKDTEDAEEQPRPYVVSPEVAIYRESKQGIYASRQIQLLPNDRVRLLIGRDGVELVVQASTGGGFDRASRFSHWTSRKHRTELGLELATAHGLGELEDIRPIRYGVSGRVAELELVGTQRNKTLTGLAIRRALGLRENLFFVDRRLSEDGAVVEWIFTGRGWGHGVGMCQVGAYGMALAGYSHEQILQHYYAGAVVEDGAPFLAPHSVLSQK